MQAKILTGNEAEAHAVCLSRVQVVPAYPITPQTTVVENLAKMKADGMFLGEFIEVESENTALAYCIGAAYAGARTFTATSSHGLAYVHELLHWAAGARLSMVLANANRALGAPWCIESDQTDSLAQRDTGWVQLYCSSVQEILDTVLLAFRVTAESKLPVLVVYDGFYLSHVHEPVLVPPQALVDSFLPPLPDKPAFKLELPRNHYGLANASFMARLVQRRFGATAEINEVYAGVNQAYYRLTGRNYPAVEYWGSQTASSLFLTAGAMTQTIQSFIQERAGEEALLKIKLFRPFPAAALQKLIHSKLKRIIVVDRNIAYGVGGILAQEVRAALYSAPYQPEILELNLAGGLDLTPTLLEKALRFSGNESIMWAVNFR